LKFTGHLNYHVAVLILHNKASSASLCLSLTVHGLLFLSTEHSRVTVEHQFS